MTRTHGLPTLILVAAALLLAAGTALAKQPPEQKCQKGRYDAAAKYAVCQQKVWGKWFGGSIRVRDFYGKLQPALSKCRVTYTDTWAKLQRRARDTGSTCDNPRFNDNGDGTVTDRLTALQWEKNAGSLGSWSAGGTAADGTAFTSFLATLNSGCFAGQCDWRLPTIYELQTIVREPYPCMTYPCIDAILGPTIPFFAYWSATTGAEFPNHVWLVDFGDGSVANGFKVDAWFVRAVRGGL